jgi:hypothetical protein
MALPEAPELELELELEALRAIHGEAAVNVVPPHSAAAPGTAALVVLDLAPRTATGAPHERFVAARLAMAVGGDYPAQPLAVELQDAKGGFRGVARWLHNRYKQVPLQRFTG